MTICFLCSFLLMSSAENIYILCKVMTTLNLREGPSAEYGKIIQIPKNSYFVAIVDEDAEIQEGAFVYGLYVDEDLYGYVSSDYLYPERDLETDRGGVLSKAGESYGYDPEIKITNSCNRNITVQINGTNYPFSPQQVRTITCPPGSVSIFASSPGVIPYSATDHVSENSLYTWKFYIETRRR